jgi:hypothetical protein
VSLVLLSLLVLGSILYCARKFYCYCRASSPMEIGS